MNLKIYRQKATKLSDGLVVYSGEDGRPYVDDNLILVSDGLGGTGAIRHRSIAPGVLDRETVVETFFKDTYSEFDERFAEYVKESFVELYGLKDSYKTNINALKKSSYFGSRLVLAIMLHHFYSDADMDPEKLIDYIAGKDGEEREKALGQLGAKVVDIIKNDFHTIAESANIFYETSIPRLKLLATTLCATVFAEREDCVEALYFISGDSRPYYWSEKEGLCQVIKDQEGEDGGMTSCIYEGGDFSILCKYYKFPKPCVLFNASDGCFDSAYFTSQMAFEKLLLDAIKDNGSVEGIEKALTAAYDVYGTHDDSSTLALRTFGFADLEEFRTACAKRLAYLDVEYLSKLESLLEVDYVAQYAKAEKEQQARFCEFKDRLWSERAVQEYCIARMDRTGYSGYSEAVTEINSEISHKKSEIRDAEDLIYGLITANFVKFFPAKKYSIQQIEKLGCGYEQGKKDYLEKVMWLKTELSGAERTLESILSELDGIGIPGTPKDFDRISFDSYRDAKKVIFELLVLYNDIYERKYKQVRKLFEAKDEYISGNRKLAEKRSAECKELLGRIVEESFDVREVDIPISEQEKILSLVSRIKTLRYEIAVLDSAEKEKVKKEVVASYYDKEHMSVIADVIKDDAVAIDAALRREVKSFLEMLKGEISSLEENAALQTALFAAYEKQYGKLMKG